MQTTKIEIRTLERLQKELELKTRLVNRIVNTVDAYFDKENDDADAEQCMEWLDDAITEYYEALERYYGMIPGEPDPESKRRIWLLEEADKIKPWREK